MTCADTAVAVLVFARAPVPAATKTRLIPALGSRGAALLQQRMTRHALQTACDSGVGPVSLWCSPSSEHAFFRACRTRFNVELHAQSGTTLGERLLDAHDRTFRAHGRLLVIGTDCPILNIDDLQAAAGALRACDAVLIPAIDGGYVLLGLARPCPHAFDAIDWGSAQVLEQTLARLRDAGAKCQVLAPLWDVDRPEDLARLQALMPGMLEGLEF